MRKKATHLFIKVNIVTQYLNADTIKSVEKSNQLSKRSRKVYNSVAYEGERAGRRRSGYCVATTEAAAAPEHLNRDRLASLATTQIP